MQSMLKRGYATFKRYVSASDIWYEWKFGAIMIPITIILTTLGAYITYYGTGHNTTAAVVSAKVIIFACMLGYGTGRLLSLIERGDE